MSTNALLNDAHNMLPPRSFATDSGEAIISQATATSPVSGDLWATYVSTDGTLGAPKGKVFVEFEAVGFDVFIRFSRTATTTTTALTGSLLKVGIPRTFFLEPVVHDKFIDHLSSGGVGTLKWRVVGPIQERNRS